MDGFEGLLPARHQDTHGVDYDLGAFDRLANRRLVAKVGLHRPNLPHGAHGLQMASQIRAPDCGPYTPAVPGERANRVPPYKARSAEHGCKSTLVKAREHACRSP